MAAVLDVIRMMGRVVINTVTSPLFIVVFSVISVLIILQYRRIERNARKTRGSEGCNYLLSAMASIGTGVLGGVLGSLLLVIAGVDLNQMGIFFLWIMALLFMLIHPRFICFAYAGGMLSLVVLISGTTIISVPHLMGLVAILHMVESMLILIDGSFNPLPVYIKKNSRFRGGFQLQKFWPLPLIALCSGTIPELSTLSMPAWWPLIAPPNEGNALSFMFIPVMAVLGYGEITTTSTPRERIKRSSGHLFGYSFTLLVLCILASYYPMLAILAALFGPLGHELVIWLGMREENQKSPLYVNAGSGVMVLAVQPGMPAHKAGLQSQDILLTANGESLRRYDDLLGLWKKQPRSLKLSVMRDNCLMTVVLTRDASNTPGIIPVPEDRSTFYFKIGQKRAFPILDILRKHSERLLARFR